MKQNVEATRKPVQLPEGHMCGNTCGDCVHLKRNDKTSEGKIYCGKWSKYVWGGDSACGSFLRY